MVRMIVLAVAAFMIAMGSATGVLFLHHRSSAAQPTDASADGVVVGDTLHGEVEPADDGDDLERDRISDGEAPRDDVVDTTAAASLPPTDSLTGASTPLPVGGIASSAGDAVAGSAAASVADTAAAPLPERRLAKIFGSMQPKEAARVLEQMDDHDVVAIMGMMNDRQAAAVLANLPPQRAAGITRLGSRAGRTTQ